MSKTRLHILNQVTVCENCGDYVATCTCTNDVQMCPSCGEHTIDCVCDEDYTPITLNAQFLRPALI